MAKKKVARRGVPTLEIVHEVREKKELPPFVLVELCTNDYDVDEYDDCDMEDYWGDVTSIKGFYHTEEEAIDRATSLSKGRRYGAEFRILQACRAVKTKVAEPVVEVI